MLRDKPGGLCSLGLLACVLLIAIKTVTVFGGQYLICYHYDEKGFVKAVDAAKMYTVDGRILGAAAPHFLPVMSFTASLLKTVAAQEEAIETVFLVGPNHGGEGLPIIITDYGWSTPFGKIESDKETVREIENSRLLNVNVNADIFHLENDHSLATLTPFIKHYLPEARIVSIMLSRGASMEELDELAWIIYGISQSKNVLLLTSVDFSHFLDIKETARRDVITDRIIRANDYGALKGLDDGNLDSAESMILLMKYASYFDSEVSLLDSVILPESTLNQNIGYSYHVYAYYEKPEKPKASFIFIGDALLDSTAMGIFFWR